MSRKILEDTVLSYFNDAPLPYAEMMLRLASGALKRRRQGKGVIDAQFDEVPAKAPVRKVRKQGENAKPDSPSGRLANAPQPV